jgi:hypothetical protein
MSLKHAAIAGAILALCVGAVPKPASAQIPDCADLYNQAITIYRAAPQSPEYAQIAAAYNANCLAGAAAAPPYPPEYQPNYGYAESDYPSYAGYGYAVPVGVGIGLGVARGFHQGGNFHEHGGFHGAAVRGDGGSHGGGGHGGEAHGGDHHDHH